MLRVLRGDSGQAILGALLHFVVLNCPWSPPPVLHRCCHLPASTSHLSWQVSLDLDALVKLLLAVFLLSD